ncbi:unnamed protein product, partial [Adineta steineri]
CSPSCQNGGNCTAPNTCTCVNGWTGETCGNPTHARRTAVVTSRTLVVTSRTPVDDDFLGVLRRIFDARDDSEDDDRRR